MKPFVFSLERMRDYKTQVLESEKNTLMALLAKLREIEEKIKTCQSFRQQKRDELQAKQVVGMNMKEMEEYKYYLDNMGRQLESLEIDRERAAMEVERQRRIVIKADQDVTSLDKLEEKQLDEYRVLETRHNEVLIQEHVINQIAYMGSSGGARSAMS